MVCIRCQITVKSELEKLGLHYTKVELGETEIMEDLSDYLSEKLIHYYTYLSNLFSEVKGTAIVMFYLAKKKKG
jgi:hypothetical protein